MMINFLKKNLKKSDDARVHCFYFIKKFIQTSIFAVLPLQEVKVKPSSEIISGLINGLLALAAGLAILFIIIGGIRYIRSWGDTEQMEKSKKMILYVVLGLVIILVSYAVVITADKIING